MTAPAGSPELPLDLGFSAVDWASEPIITDRRGELSIDFSLDHPASRRARLVFADVKWYRFTSEPLCKADQIEDAYQVLRVVAPSPLFHDIQRSPLRAIANLKLTHFLLYLEDSGAIEVLAGAVRWYPNFGPNHPR